MATNSESRKRIEGLFGGPEWSPSQRDAMRTRVLRALREVYPTSEPIDGDALLDALEDEGVVSQ